MKKILLILFLILFSGNSGAAVLDTGVIGKYALGLSEGTDSSINVNNLAKTGLPTTSISHDGSTADGATTFTGTDNQWFSGTNNDVAGQAITFSISLWLKWNGAGTLNVPLHIANKLFIGQESGSTFSVNVYTPSAQTYNITLTSGVYNHVVISINGTALTIYVDDVLVVNQTLAGNITTNTSPLLVGANTSIFKFGGAIDDLVFFDKALIQADVDELYAMADFDAPEPSIAISTPIINQPHQVSSGVSDIPITGTYYYDGTAPAIEARFDGGAWATISATPTGSVFSGTLPAQAGGHGTLEVRFTTETAVTDSVDIGLGHIIIVTGQSNANGKVDNPTVYTGTEPSFFWNENSIAWEPMVEPCSPENVGYGKYSHYPRLSNIIESDTGFPVYIIDAPMGGRGVVNGEWEPAGIAYVQAVTTVTNSGITDALCNLWYQGETEWISGDTRAAYEAQLPPAIASLVIDFGLADLETVVTAITQGSSNPLLDIRASHIALWDSVATFHPGALMIDMDLPDNVHLRSDAQSEVYCQRAWAMIKTAFLGGTITRGPRISSVVKVGTTQALATFTGVGPLQDVGTQGWTASDDSGALAISTAVIQGSLGVLITFGRTISTNPVLDYGQGVGARGGTFRDSQAVPALNPIDYGVPIEPFLAYNISTVSTSGLKSWMGKPTTGIKSMASKTWTDLKKWAGL